MNLHPTLEKAKCHKNDTGKQKGVSPLNLHSPQEKAGRHKHDMGNKSSIHEHSDIGTFTNSDEHRTKLMTDPPKAAEGIITDSCGLLL